jgi:Domain of unknown function (DUF4349)
MMKSIRVLTLLLLLGLTAACAKKAVSSDEEAGSIPGSISGESAKPGSMLAYEHAVSFRVAPDSMLRRVGAVQSACNEERFGACSVLSIESDSGDFAQSSITVRVIPSGVESLVAMAGEGDAMESRQTKVEDLADAVADVAAQQDMLRRQSETLRSYIARKDLVVADMIAVSQQLANVESMLHSLEQDSANQRRRIETNRLTIKLSSNVSNEAATGFSLRVSWETFSDSLAEGTDDAAEYAGYFLPIVLLVFPLALLWRWAWRWVTRKSRSSV